MNAKKIMGAVLVALLAAALFVGAGAAAVNVGTVFVNQGLPDEVGGESISDLTWTDSTGAAVTPLKDPMNPNKYYFPKAGVYTTTIATVAEYSITVVSPGAIISGVAGQVAGTENTAYPFIPGTYYVGTTPKVSILPGATGVDLAEMTVYVTNPNGDTIVNGGAVASAITQIQTAIGGEKPILGEYSIVVVYDADLFVNGTTVDMQKTTPVTFKVAEAGDVTISASVDQTLKSKPFTVKVTGQPGLKYKFEFDENAFTIDGDQIGFVGANPQPIHTDDEVSTIEFTMPNTGFVEVVVKVGSTQDNSEKLTVKESTDAKNKASVTIKFAKGTISAKADAASYFVGDVITISGTNTAGEIVGYTIKGTNFEYTFGNDDDETISWEEGDASSATFEFEIATADVENEKSGLLEGKKLDVGTYTLTIFVDNMGLEENEEPTAKATVALVLKQPFLTIVEAPEVIVQETDVKFIINAEATTEIAYYIFGTNYFYFKPSVAEDDEIENQFTIELGKGITKNMSAGQYFMVIQHPMYDTFFNIMAEETTFYLNTTGDAAEIGGTKLFSFDIRQTANAAQALCDNLDSQTIDDMYVKYSFFVVGEDESFTISTIPTTVAQGETLTISGVSTSNADDFVTVEMISTAFAAVPKETVGSASFIVLTTQIAEDGTWEVTFDTSDLNVDEYSLKVSCGDSTWKNVEINVVEGADTPDTPDTPDVPDTPDTPDTPTEPETPGFGALAALAGLGAVAVLLLRRE